MSEVLEIKKALDRVSNYIKTVETTLKEEVLIPFESKLFYFDGKHVGLKTNSGLKRLLECRISVRIEHIESLMAFQFDAIRASKVTASEINKIMDEIYNV